MGITKQDIRQLDKQLNLGIDTLRNLKKLARHGFPSITAPASQRASPKLSKVVSAKRAAEKSVERGGATRGSLKKRQVS